VNLKNLTHNKRNEVVECGRFLAAICIIWLHTVGAVGYLPMEYSARWDRWAVPFFIAASLWFSNPRDQNRSPWEYIKMRFLRLYPVFLVWNVFYLAIRLVSGVFFHSSLHMDGISFVKQLFFDGFAHHLWFLTFLILVDFGIAICSLIGLSSWIIVPVSAICLGVISNLPTSFYPTFGSYLIGMSWWSLPAVFMLVIMKPFIRSIIERGYIITFSATFLIVGILLTWASSYGPRNSEMEAASGIFLFLGFLLAGHGRKTQIPQSICNLAAMSAGIYLVHVFYVEAFQHISFSLTHSVRSSFGVFCIFTLSLLCSLMTVLLLNKLRIKWIFSGFSLAKKLKN
jgi:peptidoglycan/LPS O-acetylase OafA/YrhL